MEHLGKKRRLNMLSDSSGRFSMLAIDQRQSLRKMIAEQTKETPEKVAVASLKLVKRVVTSRLAYKASALLIDPRIGYASAWQFIPAGTGVLLSMEQTGYATVNQRERLTRLLPEWDVQKALAAGADGVKLLIWYNKDASDATLEHQTSIVRAMGEACERHSIPFILEVVCYPLDDALVTRPEFAHQKAMWVIDAARTFSRPEYRVDVLKLEFPGNLKYVKEYQSASFAGGDIIHDLSEIQDFCHQVNMASTIPWVILSAGVEPEEFIENIRICNNAGASGFLCGRAIWKDITRYFPDTQAMESYLSQTASAFFDAILSANHEALPWYQHEKYRLQSDSFTIK
ncbi:tagatose 1,6-diphosphate aldolase [Balneolales bacterium ANBcel1]|nr:tagatose 1,6-diphosphate aldolase [Balneolales bacterium ANBcel1]